MKIFVLLAIISTSSLVLAENKVEQRHQSAHVHGSANLNIAFDLTKGKIEFEAASEGILGFEHKVKSETDKKKLSDSISQFESNISSMIKFEDALNCTFAKEKIELETEPQSKKEDTDHKHHSEHSNFIAVFNVNCKKELKNSKLTLDFSLFKRLKDIDVTILIGDLQKSLELKQKPITLDLK
jgi:hypothetical protein